MENFTIYECYNLYLKNCIEFERQVKLYKDNNYLLQDWNDLFKCIDKVFYIVNHLSITYNIRFEELNINKETIEPNTIYTRFYFRSNKDTQIIWNTLNPQANNYTIEVIFNNSIIYDDIRNITLSIFDEYIRLYYIQNGLSAAFLRSMIENNKI